MKINLLLAIFLLVTGFATAQSLQSGPYSIVITQVKKEKLDLHLFGQKTTGVSYSGNYSIKKDGKKMVSNTFSSQQFDGGNKVLTLNLQNGDGSGNSLTYDFETKSFEFAGEEFKVKTNKDTIDLLLAGMLFYGQWMAKQE